MTCSDVRTWLHGFLDGELDLARQVEIEEHLRGCDPCSRVHRELTALRSELRSDDLYFKAPAHLARWAREAARPPARKAWPARFARSPWLGAVVGAAAVIVVGVLVGPTLFLPSPSERIAEDVVAAHVRSLMPGHLTDVESSEQHTVKPWFAGKLDFAPAVVDLAGDGYPLAGGRLDYADRRPVAALVYRHGAHVVNLFVWPSSAARDTAVTTAVRQGYNLAHWSRGQADYWAVSDLDATELGQFARLVRSGGSKTP
jgi:anti-sigma factor RsiW